MMANVIQAVNYPPGNWSQIIENKVFNTTLILNGSNNDNTLIINSKFNPTIGPGIRLCGVKNVYIIGNEIYNVPSNTGGHGIELGSSTGCGTDNVTIENNKIHDLRNSGIIPKGSPTNGTYHNNLIIRKNLFYNIGRSDKDHGIYNIAGDVQILNNVIHGSMGNGISTRTSGVIRGNIIWDTVKSCIRYFTDHETGPSKTLTIENNVCNNVVVDTKYTQVSGYPLVSLLYSPDTGSPSWLVDRYIIRFNTLVSTKLANPGIMVQSAEFDSKRVEVYGNLVINTGDKNLALVPKYIDYNSRNFSTNLITGFRQDNLPFDFHLTKNSLARGYATGESFFPDVDRDGVMRRTTQLDAGAWQFIEPTELVKIGDVNADGNTDLLDFANWKKAYLEPASAEALAGKADFDKNGMVDLADFAIWKKAYLKI
jgi:hypothetical protein